MTSIRARTGDLLTHVKTILANEAQQAAGNNLLSRPEQNALPAGFLKSEAEHVRAGSGNNRVAVDAWVSSASDRFEELLSSVNTSGPGFVSKLEIQRLFESDADAGTTAARAYELITGKAIVVGASTSPPPPPLAGTRANVSSVEVSPPPSVGFLGQTAMLFNGGLRIEDGAEQAAKLTFQVDGRTFTASFPSSERMSGRISNVATPADVVEAIRKAVAPDYDVRVTKHAGSTTEIDLWSRPAPANTGAPIYLFSEIRDAAGTRAYHGLELRGPLRFVCNHQDTMSEGEALSVRIDDKVFTTTAKEGDSIKKLMRNIRDQVVAAGYTVDLREYTNYAPWTFIVEKP